MNSLSGADDLINKLNTLGAEMKTTIVKKAVGKAAQRVRAEAVLLCPVDKGELRQSIKTSVEASGYEVTGTTYTNKEYASYVEFGTGPMGQENHSGISTEITPTYSAQGWSYKDDNGEWIYTNGQAAQPFMYPALKNNESRVKKIIKEEIASDIGKLVD